MDLAEFLNTHQKTIASQWTNAIIRTYPEEGGKFFAGSANQFANPVGHVFRNNTEKMLRILTRGDDVAACTKELDEILRIRAVQGFSPSVALCFVPALREIIFQELFKAYPSENISPLLRDLSVRIDQLAMLAFDLYMTARELLWKQKANQLYNRTHKLLEKANLLQETEVAKQCP